MCIVCVVFADDLALNVLTCVSVFSPCSQIFSKLNERLSLGSDKLANGQHTVRERRAALLHHDGGEKWMR